MKNRKILMAMILATAPLLPSVRAQTAAPAVGVNNLTVTAALDYESQYVFRGKKVTDSAFQPNADLGYKISDAVGSIHAYVWTSQPIGRAGNSAGPNQTNEIDSGVYWDYPTDALGLKNGTIETGYQYYWYPDVGGSQDDLKFGNHLSRSDEVHAAFQYDATDIMGANWNVNPQVWYYHDFILDSNTLVFAISHTFSMDDWMQLKGFSLKPSANFGWTGIHRVLGDETPTGRRNWRDSYAFWGANLELDYRLSSWCTAFARLEYSGNNDGTAGGPGVFANPQTPASGQNDIWAGLGLSFGM
jgi:hypothetical protein